jgi:hypothetical protein
MDKKSRMKREFYVRFCEGLGGKFPRATRPSSENNRADNTDVFKSLRNLDGSKDDIPNESLFNGDLKGLSPGYNGKE